MFYRIRIFMVKIAKYMRYHQYNGVMTYFIILYPHLDLDALENPDNPADALALSNLTPSLEP